ncbi:CWF19-like protein 1 [Tribolium castaneum]|uniref:CWF19-like protein 1 homolog n=2 Tax=Tribolium castaneum TaxID=7070 RepID=A0A139WF76_TRICA|nr:PREDICTED: CWF19-like protein 1 [Tribolium castaneum]KYB26604.1 CWF19-like protein 1 homolog [Tribolium castaneum]|eukprot:XP_008195322.1 PREDICTED: CWF19-like protein 1 [Tribolium castaneum]
MSNQQKILFCGDVEGQFEALFTRVARISEKQGKFDCLFCVGNFFGINNKEFGPYLRGEKKVPIATYILGPNSLDQVKFYPKDDAFELCENVFCLRSKGVYNDIKGFRIAYLSGIAGKESNDYEYTAKDVTELYDMCVRGNPCFRGVDVLLTSQWPADVTRNDPKQVKLTVNTSTELVSWLVMKLKPRYHVSGLEGVYYERSPFRAPNLGDHDTTINLVTRFVGLARVKNPKKEKWIYALGLPPLDTMKLHTLLQKTTDETDCPFDFAELEQKIFNNKKKSQTPCQYFYDTSAPVEGQAGPRAKKMKIEFDQSKCWFCLASPSVEKHLIITVASSTYLALAKGGIVDEHFLICPIQHYQNSLGQPQEVAQEIEKFKQALRKFYARNGQVPVFFERNYKTSHMQLQVVPVPKEVAKELKASFIDEAGAHGLKLELLGSNSRLDQVLQANVPYFTVELPDGVVLYTKIKGVFPLNFAREVLVTAPILNCPLKVDWRSSVLGKDCEKELVEKLRADFEPFDFTND